MVLCMILPFRKMSIPAKFAHAAHCHEVLRIAQSICQRLKVASVSRKEETGTRADFGGSHSLRMTAWLLDVAFEIMSKRATRS